MVREEIKEQLKKALKELGGEEAEPEVSRTQNLEHGDYATNVAMIMFGRVSKEGKVSEAVPAGRQVSKAERKEGSKVEGVEEVEKVERGDLQPRKDGNREEGTGKFESAMVLAQKIAGLLNTKYIIPDTFSKIEAVKPGFINFYLSKEHLLKGLENAQNIKKSVHPQKIMVEYAHPNTHKEMHIGHMRTLITGESISRLLEACGNQIFRANYQGDIGPHVAKAVYGIQKIMEEKNLALEEVDKWPNSEKAHFLGQGYVRGNQDYENHKEEIGGINRELYKMVTKEGEQVSRGVSEVSKVSEGGLAGEGSKVEEIEKVEEVDKGNTEVKNLEKVYQITRKWSLDYYDDFYKKFYTKFDRLFFESEVADEAKKKVEENVGKVFKKDDGTIVFLGEDYGLHTRVFVTKAGYPTYEGKDMALGFRQFQAFPFDKNIHVVANEQASYFKVVFKALELLDPEKFKGREFHLSMGMVQLTDRKMSSRTGEVLTVDWLIDQVREMVLSLIKEGKIQKEEEHVLEDVVIGAIKHSVLKVGTGQDAQFDIKKSVSLDGNSGPYLQYTYARTQSILAKSQITNMSADRQDHKSQINTNDKKINVQNQLEQEELVLLRLIHRFSDVVVDSADNLAPNILANYLFDLAQKFNLFYQKHKVIESENEEFRLKLTGSVGQALKKGLDLLGIKAPQRM